MTQQSSLQVSEGTPPSPPSPLPPQHCTMKSEGPVGSPLPVPQLGFHSTTQNGSSGTGSDLLENEGPSWGSSEHTCSPTHRRTDPQETPAHSRLCWVGTPVCIVRPHSQWITQQDRTLHGAVHLRVVHTVGPHSMKSHGQ